MQRARGAPRGAAAWRGWLRAVAPGGSGEGQSAGWGLEHGASALAITQSGILEHLRSPPFTPGVALNASHVLVLTPHANPIR